MKAPRLVAAALCLIVASPVLAQGALDRIKSRGSIVLAHRDASIPFSYLADGKPVGYALDLCQRIAEAIGKNLGLRDLRVQYRAVTSATRFEVIERGEADLECGSTTNNAERRKRVAFTIPHFVASSRLMVPSQAPYERLEDLQGKRIVSTKGSTSLGAVERETRMKNMSVTLDAAPDHAESTARVLAGTADAFAMDDVLLYGLRATSAKPQALKIIGKSMTVEPYAIAFERDNAALKRIVDAEMRRLIASRELHKLYARWFQSPIPPKAVNLEMRMPYLLSDSLKYPTDFVPD